MKRRIALIVAMLMLLSLFAACGPEKPDPVKPGEEAMTPAGYRDFNGETVNYLCDENCASYLDPSLGEGTAWDDYIRDHVAKIESDMNLTFKFEEDHALVQRLQASALSGGTEFDLVLAPGDSLIPLYSTGIFADIKNLDAIDLSDEEKFGPESIRTFAEYQGGLYSLYQVGNVTWPTSPYNIFNALLINDELVEELNANHPVEMYEQGNWTFNTFKSYLQSVTSNDPSNYIYGLDATWFGSWILAQSALYANGCPPIVENAQGKYEFGYTSTAAAHALEWARDIYSMSENVATEKDPAMSESSYFVTGNATMYLGHSYYLTTLSSDIQQNLEQISFVPFPYGEDVEFGSISTGFYDTPIATSIVKNGDEQDTAYILNHLLDPMEGNMNGEYYDYIKEYCFPDDNNSYDLYFETSRNASYQYTAQLSNVYKDITEALNGITKGERSVTEAITSITNRVNAEIDTQFN